MNKVEEFLDKYNLKDKILTFEDSSATVELAAMRLNVDSDRIAKTLSFYIDDRVLVIVVTGNMKIDNSKYKAEFKSKAKMIPFAEVEEKVGHPVGGVCPFAVNDNVEIYLDVSLKKYDTVFPACGSDHNAIEISPSDLERVTNNIKWVDVCKDAS